MPSTRFFAIVILICAFAFNVFMQTPNDLKSRAEATNFEETSRYDDVIQFMTELQKRSPLVRVETFGTSQDGRKLPLMILSEPPVSTPVFRAAW